MPLFSARLDYALRAVIDLALHDSQEACQSREIAVRQDIRGPYLDQILAALKREGIVRSIRGAGGGYRLARASSKITVGDVIRAVVGDNLLIGPATHEPKPEDATAAYVVRRLAIRLEQTLAQTIDEITLGDMVAQKQRLDDSLSIMPGI
jgi:Rrf2 family protein